MKQFKEYLLESTIDVPPSRESIKKWLSQHLVVASSTHISDITFISSNENAICGEYLDIITNESELPFKFGRCNTFTITAPNLKTLKNVPISSKSSYSVELFFTECYALDFSKNTFGYTYTAPLNMTITRHSTVHIKDFTTRFINVVTFDECSNMLLYDLSTYDTHIETVRLNTLHQLKNVTGLLTNPKCDINEFYIVQDVTHSFYDEDKMDKLEEIISKYLVYRENKETYAMDLTVDLIDNGFEDEV